MKKQIFAGLLALVMSLSGCAGGSTGGNKEAEAAQGTTQAAVQESEQSATEGVARYPKNMQTATDRRESFLSVSEAAFDRVICLGQTHKNPGRTATSMTEAYIAARGFDPIA